jgi:hypothetical protein
MKRIIRNAGSIFIGGLLLWVVIGFLAKIFGLKADVFNDVMSKIGLFWIVLFLAPYVFLSSASFIIFLFIKKINLNKKPLFGFFKFNHALWFWIVILYFIFEPLFHKILNFDFFSVVPKEIIYLNSNSEESTIYISSICTLVFVLILMFTFGRDLLNTRTELETLQEELKKDGT